MKKKLLSVLLSTAMVASLLVGCGSKETESPAAETTTDETEETEETTVTDETETDETATDEAVTVPEDTGKVLNIHCWNEEFARRVKAYYPGYEDEIGRDTPENLKTIGSDAKIGDIKVNWVITPNEGNAYQNKLDEAILAQESAADDDKIDIFLIEADYALKYVNSDASMNVADIGLTAEDMSGQYKYTQDIVKDSNGNLKGTTWQATPGLFAYRRSIAKDVLGTDDPTEVQAKLADWDKFVQVAADAKEKGYQMLSGYDDSYRTFSNNVSGPWVQDGKIVVDENLMNWVKQTKEFTDNGYNNKTSLWDESWQASQGADGKVFGYFYSPWGIDFTLKENAGGDAANGLWAVCQGPESYYWGGTWICAATGTDNANLVKDIMYQLTCNPEIMTKITEIDQDFTNNTAAMDAIANSDFKSEFLGGQNHIKLFAEVAPKIDMSNISPYDQGLNEDFQGAFKDYFDGNATEEEALADFYSRAETKYPELTH